MAIQFLVNSEKVVVDDALADMPLLWYLREEAGLKGTKFGCGIGQCGACTVHLNGESFRSCLITLSQMQNAEVTTIEGLAISDDELHPVQSAWMNIDVPQCGYCQSGQIMAASAMLKNIPNPSDDDIDRVMTNICRCGTYPRIRQAIKDAAKELAVNVG